MNPEIFRLDAKTCHLFFNDYLVFNLPLDRLEECRERLKSGKSYRYPKCLFDRMYQAFVTGQAEGGWDLCCSFRLDGKFKVRIMDSDATFLRRGLLHREASARRLCYLNKDLKTLPTLNNWLDEQLIRNNFTKITRLIPKKHYLINWLWCLGMFVLVLGALGYIFSDQLSITNMLFIGVIVLTAFLVISIVIIYCLATMGFKEVIYTKT